MKIIRMLAVCVVVLAGGFGVASAAPESPDITLEAVLPDPILPGDLLTLRGKDQFTHGQLNGLTFSIGPLPAEVLSVANDTVKVIVPPFVPAGLQPLTVMRHGRVEFSQAIPIGEIHVSALGTEGPFFRFGLNFSDPKAFAAGTGVSGCLQTTTEALDAAYTLSKLIVPGLLR